jgi:hypothetical protein
MHMPMPNIDPHTAPPALQAHLGQCAAACGPGHHVLGLLSRVHAALQPRLVTTLLVLLALMSGALWLA